MGKGNKALGHGCLMGLRRDRILDARAIGRFVRRADLRL